MYDLKKLKEMITDGGYTCVLSDGKDVFSSRDRGVKPLVEIIGSGKNFHGYIAADKIVGRAAAFLYAYLGIWELYAEVISEKALQICKEYGITVEYGGTVEKIINRAGDDVCPMEKSVEGINDPQAALEAIKAKLKSLGK